VLSVTSETETPDVDVSTVVAAARDALEISDTVSITASIGVTSENLWQTRISIWNEKTIYNTASEIATAQVLLINNCNCDRVSPFF
jgi:hypothetical protein